jgi:DNA polymerase-3 subunit delta
MIYLLYGNEEFSIEQEIKKIINDNHIDSLNISHYDLDDDLINNVIDDASMIPLFGDKKIITVRNAYLFTDSTKKGIIDQDPSVLDDYLHHLNPDTILIFTVISDKISERKKISKLLKEIGIIKSLNYSLKLF